MTSYQIELRAFHEAGHAAVANALGVRVQKATLSNVLTLPTADNAWARPLIALASPLSEDRYQRYSPEQFRNFWTQFRNFWTTTWSRDLTNASAALNGGDAAAALNRARRLVILHWDAIELVAAALLERGQLTGREITAVLGRGP